MVKLYYSAGSCSTSCHISLEEAGLKYEATELDFDKDADAKLVSKLNPMGTLPIAVINGEQQLDQNLAIHTYIADQAPQTGLLPKMGTPERYEAITWLSFVSSDLHKAFSPLFALKYISSDEKAQADVRNYVVANLNEALAHLDNRLNGRDYIMGKTFTVADSYAFVVVGWTQYVNVSLAPYKNIQNYMTRVSARPAVQRVLKAEGLLN